jgi:hypothetical protein
MNVIINEETPVGALTVRQLKSVMGVNETTKESISKVETKKQYVYGLAGVKQLFKVSHATAQRYKDTIIKDAVMQQGRKIIVDVEKAIELFNNHK